MTIENPTILLVDDSDNDSLLMRIGFERAGFVRPLQLAHDSDEAICYLQGAGPYSDRVQFPMPVIVLLDLNMPRKSGFVVLEWIRQQPALRQLRVYILSASNRPDDIDRAYELGASSYLVKPSTLDGLTQMAKYLFNWIKISHFALPPHEPSAPKVSDARGLGGDNHQV